MDKVLDVVLKKNVTQVVCEIDGEILVYNFPVTIWKLEYMLIDEEYLIELIKCFIKVSENKYSRILGEMN